METYQNFMDRICSFELPVPELCEGDFSVNPSVSEKVGTDHRFLPFYGDTIVFDLSEMEKQLINDMISQLYTAVPECFSERLNDSTLHMTLHDLSHSTRLEDVSERMREHETALRTLLAHKPVEQKTIRMRSKAVFNMVNTSIVLGVYPNDPVEYAKLMELYQLGEQLMALPYPMTPHITLAYYRKEGFSHELVEKLKKQITALNRQPMEITLQTERLYYQHFQSMNAYQNRLCLVL